MTTAAPLVSVVVATYNVADCLEATLKSVLDQTLAERELIVIDGGSQDQTPALLQHYDRALDYWVSAPDRGVYDAFNKGIAQARGTWLYFLGAGDLLADPDVFKRLFATPTQAQFIYGKVWQSDRNQEYGGIFSKARLCEENICQQAIFYHRDLLQRLGRFDLRYPVLADWAFNLKCFGLLEPEFRNEVIARYQGGGLSTKTKDTHFQRDFLSLLGTHLGLNYAFHGAKYRLGQKLGVWG